jgi:hypothetical protein
MKLVPTQGHNLVTGLFGAYLLTSASLPSPDISYQTCLGFKRNPNPCDPSYDLGEVALEVLYVVVFSNGVECNLISPSTASLAVAL